MTVTKISTAINNEIVLLRQCVRRARICVINKLVREAKRLRANRGNEKLLEKNKNKAEKYLREVAELKRVKDDEISKFGITHLEKLVYMLQNSQTDDRTRAIVKVVRYKCLNEKIMEFVKKFPNCQEYVSLDKNPSKKKKKNSTSEHSQKKPKQLPNIENDNEHAKNNRLNMSDIDGKASPQTLKQTTEDVQSEGDSVKSKEETLKLITKVVSKQATVKRFVDVLQESSIPRIDDRHEETKEQRSSPTSAVLTRPDDFFLNSDKVVAVHVNAATFSQEKDSNTVSKDMDKKMFTTFPKRNVKREFSRYERNQENTSKKRRDVGNKDVLHRRSNTTETNAVFSEQKKRFPGIKETSKNMHKSFEKNHTKSTENESLHPSWAARRKLQDAMKQGFQGKKIRFEET